MTGSSTNSGADFSSQFSSPLDFNQATTAVTPADPLRDVVTSSLSNRSSLNAIDFDDNRLPIGNFGSVAGFTSGWFTVGNTGQVSIDYLYDGGGYEGDVGIFSLEGLDQLIPGSTEFMQAVIQRVLSHSTLGHLIISDRQEGARFESGFNAGDYLGVKTFAMQAGDRFGMVLLPNGTFAELGQNPTLEGSQRPLFSLSTANPISGFQFGQIADVTGQGSTFVFEDLRVDGDSDRDYEDIVLQVRGAIGFAPGLDQVINPGNDWRNTDLGKKIQEALYPIDLPTLPIDPLNGAEYFPGNLLVRFDPSLSQTEIQAIAQQLGAIGIEPLDSTDNSSQWQVLNFTPETNLLQIRSVLAQNANVSAIDLNYKLSVNFSRDSLSSNLWGLNNTGQLGGRLDADIDLPEAWRFQTGSPNVTVAVIDTGIDYRHPDLAPNIWRNPREIPGNNIDDDLNGFIDDVIGYDFINNDNNPMDNFDKPHGTHVAGTIGAVGNNNIGIVGVSPNVKLMPLKFMNSTGGSTLDAARAVNYATSMGAKVINASFGGGGYSQAMFDSIQRANRAGVTFVASAGNDNQNTDSNPQFPAAYNLPNVISVAATDRWDQRATFSNFGRNTVDIGAPGVGIISTLLNNNYGSMDGTSMAAPHVAGVAALLYAQNQNRSATEIRDLMLQSGDSVNSLQNITATGRRLNANNAVIRGMIGEGSRAPALFRAAFDNVLGSNYDFAPIGNAYRWGNGWTQELRDSRGNRVLIMLEDGATTAYTVFGSNLDEYLVLGGPVGTTLDGRSVNLGYPRSNENAFTNPRDGRRAIWQQFAADNGKSRIHNLNGFASVATWGTIGSLYTDMSGASGWLGMPTRREYFDGDTVFSDFQGGRIAYGWNNGRVEALRPGEQPSWRRQFFSESVGLGQWYADVFRWNGSAQPPTNFSTDRANLLATLNLGSSTRNDGKQGLNQDWGMGSLRDSRLPNDAFAVRSYTQARFEAGKTYRAWVRADDGYQLFAKRANTNEWYYFTPRDEWKTDAYGTHRAIEFQVPISGDYDFHFQYYEGGGNAYFDLFWEEVRTQPSGLMSLSQKLAELMSGQWNGKTIDVDEDNGPQCWDLVAYATGNISKTTTWRRGANVIANGSVAIGTAIATFLGPNNSYDHPNLQQHTAIFAGYGNENGVSGFYVWDQNFNAYLNGDLSIKKHFIRTNRSGTSDADNYYVVQV